MKHFLPLLLLALLAPSASAQKYASHPPMRPLHHPGPKSPSAPPGLYVDAKSGSDQNPGSVDKPWKTLAHAVTKLQPGDTLYLREGIYREHVTVRCQGTAAKPITIAGYPGEYVSIDGGIGDFYDNPEMAWEPNPNGAPGEFISTKKYADLGGRSNEVNLLGHFAESMVPLHGYKFLSDLRSTNVYWNVAVNVLEDKNGIYCGPGLVYEPTTGRIHVRLAHTNMKYFAPEDNYAGETDPRKLKLIVAAHRDGPPLSFRGAHCVVIENLEVKGARDATIDIADCTNLVFDGLTVYAGSTAFRVKDTHGLRVVNTACRGIAAPWTFRGSLKYRSIEARIFSASGWTPTYPGNTDFEMAQSEFTDSVDGVFLGSVKKVRFHHNLVENVSDDAIFVTAGTGFDGATHGGDQHYYQNRFARNLTCFAFGVGHGRQKALEGKLQTGSGVYIFRNVFDFRRPVSYHQPQSAEAPQEVNFHGRMMGDHGSPAWEPMWIYHNTVIADDGPPRYSYGHSGVASGMGKGTTRRVYNNIFLQFGSLPGATLPSEKTDFDGDHNLNWSVKLGPDFKGDFFAKTRVTKAFKERMWGQHDQFADPKFAELHEDWKKDIDIALKPGSPALKAGKILPDSWPDPLRTKGVPDLGALPAGGDLGRFGLIEKRSTLAMTSHPKIERPNVYAALVAGYPAADLPLYDFALEKRGIQVETFDKVWLPTKDYGKYQVVALIGDLVRAKMDTSVFNAEDLGRVEAFLNTGGTLLLVRRGKDAFRTPDGQKKWAEWFGPVPIVKTFTSGVLQPKHPWIDHFDAKKPPAWIGKTGGANENSIRVTQGERILGSPEGPTLLVRRPVGKGQIVYIGWDIAEALPRTREKDATPAEEAVYEEQLRILTNITAGFASR